MNQDQCTAQHKQLLHLFTTEYEKYVSHMDKETQKELRQVAPMVFAKWYHTTLAPDTILSPINIISLDFDTENKEKVYTLRTVVNEENKLEYEFTLQTYSMAHHPIIKDLQLILDQCTPACSLDKEGQFLPDTRNVLLEKLSLCDTFYLEYLTMLCHQMGFFQELPAIHIRKIQKSNTAEDFFTLPLEKQLHILLDEACYLAAQRFLHVMDLDSDTLDIDFFHNFLTAPQTVDNIFIDFYHRLQIDIRSLWETPPEELSEEDHSLLSSFLFAGIMLDKWFLTPMSCFLRVIRPISFVPIDFYRLVNNLSGMILMNHNLSPELYSPASYYSMTALGKSLCELDKTAENKQAMPKNISFEQILQVILPEIESRLYKELNRLENNTDILQFYVGMEQDTELWKVVEAETSNNLHTFCRDLCAAFNLENVQDYVLSIPDQNAFPIKYSPLGSKRSVNKTNHLTLGDIPLAEHTQIHLIPEGNTMDTIILVMQKKQPGDAYLTYPRVCKQSEKVTNLEQIDEIY